MSEKTENNVRLGIIGLGAQGGMYAGLLADGRIPGMSLGAITDNDPAKKELATQKHAGVPFYDDYIAMLDSGEVDAVVTTVPHFLHPEMTITAIGKGIHTLTEKPAGVYTKQVEEMNDFAAAHPETTFAIMFNQRTNPVYTDLKALIESGELGALRHTSWIITTWWRPQGYYDQSAWRATWGGEGGGVLVNQAPHQLDLWQWLCGTPKKVFAKLAFGFQRDIATEDEVNAVVDFGEGATGHFMTSTNDIIGTDRLEMLFDKGKVVVDASKKVTITRLSEDEAVPQRQNDDAGRRQALPRRDGPLRRVHRRGEGVRVGLGTAAHRRPHQLRGPRQRRDPADRGRHRGHQRRAPRLGHAAVRVDRTGDRPGRLPRRGVPRGAQQAHQGRGEVPGPVLIAPPTREHA